MNKASNTIPLDRVSNTKFLSSLVREVVRNFKCYTDVAVFIKRNYDEVFKQQYYQLIISYLDGLLEAEDVVPYIRGHEEEVLNQLTNAYEKFEKEGGVLIFELEPSSKNLEAALKKVEVGIKYLRKILEASDKQLENAVERSKPQLALLIKKYEELVFGK